MNKEDDQGVPAKKPSASSAVASLRSPKTAEPSATDASRARAVKAATLSHEDIIAGPPEEELQRQAEHDMRDDRRTRKVYVFLTGFYPAITSIHTTRKEAEDVMRRWLAVYQNNYDNNQCAVEEWEVGEDPVPYDPMFHAKLSKDGWYVHALDSNDRDTYAHKYKDGSICLTYKAASYAEAVTSAPIELERAVKDGTVTKPPYE